MLPVLCAFSISTFLIISPHGGGHAIQLFGRQVCAEMNTASERKIDRQTDRQAEGQADELKAVEINRIQNFGGGETERGRDDSRLGFFVDAAVSDL